MTEERLTSFQEEVLKALGDEWKNLREIAADTGVGFTLSGSGWENAADALVSAGRAEVKKATIYAPMGKLYRRKQEASDG